MESPNAYRDDIVGDGYGGITKYIFIKLVCTMQPSQVDVDITFLKTNISSSSCQ